ncbi:MAG: hypothetical protein VB021_06010 [Oscillospiraceae bacterium]|nr:hypothetical protein [Oscillospiraceae bacterium]
MKNRRIDFYRAYNKKPQLSAEARERLLRRAAPAALALVLALILGAEGVKYARLGRQIAAEQAYLADADVTEAYKTYESLSGALEAANYRSAQLEAAAGAADSYPTLDAALVRAVTGAYDGVSVTGYAYSDDGGTLTVSGSCSSVSNAAQYAKALGALDVFSHVGYYGYSSQDGRSYTFTVQCVLAQEAEG